MQIKKALEVVKTPGYCRVGTRFFIVGYCKFIPEHKHANHNHDHPQKHQSI
jgi:hypothetical protein